MVRTATFLAAPLAAALALLGCGGGEEAEPAPATSAAPAAVEVGIADFLFEPDGVVVAAGGKVTWRNDDSASHTATEDSDPPVFDTGILKAGDTDTVSFADPGTYAYICALHPFMGGTVTVE